MNKLKILVASHKPDKVYKDEVYTPIHVGRAISHYKEEMSDMIGDDTGDNISDKNKSYCELTALYWAWKNLKDVEYVGLAHYRRYFGTKFTNENIGAIMKDCDVVLAKPYIHDRYMEFKLARTLVQEDEVILLNVIKYLYPDYEQVVIDYLYDFIDIPYNMFVMKRELFDDYSRFLFSILFKCEKLMKPLPYTCSMRRMGGIAEYLLPIYCIKNNLRIRYENVVDMIGHHTQYKVSFKQKIKLWLLHSIYDKYKPKCFNDMFLQSVVLGLKNDGINIFNT